MISDYVRSELGVWQKYSWIFQSLVIAKLGFGSERSKTLLSKISKTLPIRIYTFYFEKSKLKISPRVNV